MTIADGDANHNPARGDEPRHSYRPPNCVEPRSHGVHYPGMHYQMYMCAIEASTPTQPQPPLPRPSWGRPVILLAGFLILVGALAFGLLFSDIANEEKPELNIPRQVNALTVADDDNTPIAVATQQPVTLSLSTDTRVAMSKDALATPAATSPYVPVAPVQLASEPPPIKLTSTAPASMAAPVVAALSLPTASALSLPVLAADPVSASAKDRNTADNKALQAQVHERDSRQAGIKATACNEALRAMQLCGLPSN